MAKHLNLKQICGVWSAAPTPFTDKMTIDKVAIKRAVEHQVKLGINGLFLCGTCGEGPWMTNAMRRTVVQETVQANQGRMLISVQVTDNSENRILENIAAAKANGADIAVIAAPDFAPFGHKDRLLDLYLKTIDASVLPVGIYDRGQFSPTFVPGEVLKEVFARKKVVLVKDSSADAGRRREALRARAARRGLRLLNGWEFNTIPYIESGYDGQLLGGGIFNGYMAQEIIAAVKAGDKKKAETLQQRMNRVMYAVFGGKKLKCWLTGQKQLLVEMGIFRTANSILGFPMTDTCARAIKRVAATEAAKLLPYR